MANPQKHPISYRRMTYADLDKVYPIETSAHLVAWSRGLFNDVIRVGYDCWVLEQNKKIKAFAIMSFGAGECHLLNIAVHPNYQNKGLGRLFMVHMIETARHKRAKKIYLEVRPSNKYAIHLYEDLGFKKIGERKEYYPGPGDREDAWVYAIQFKSALIV